MKYTVFLILLLLPLSIALAQNKPIKLRHIEGYKSIKLGSTINLGIKEKTHTLLLGYNHYIKNDMFIGIDLSHEFGEIELSKVRNANLNAYFNYTVFSYKSIVFLNLVGGGFVGIENIESKVVSETDNLNSFIGGALYGISAEIFISNTICIEPFITQYWQMGSQIGNSFYNKGFSVKYNF